MFTLFIQHNIVHPVDRALIAMRSNEWLQDDNLIAEFGQTGTKTGRMQRERTFSLSKCADFIFIVITGAGRINAMVLNQVRQELERFQVTARPEIGLTVRREKAAPIIQDYGIQI